MLRGFCGLRCALLLLLSFNDLLRNGRNGPQFVQNQEPILFGEVVDAQKRLQTTVVITDKTSQPGYTGLGGDVLKQFPNRIIGRL